MRLGSRVFTIEAEVQGPMVKVDLMHLENRLKEIGYSVEPSLRQLQDGQADVAKISPSVYNGSVVRKNNGIFELVVYYEDKKLDEFACRYDPVSLKSKTQA